MATKHLKASTNHTTAKKPEANLPRVSKQTAGGILGAAVGGMVGGPVGAVVGGVAGAMVGNASAAGQHPVETAIENVRAVTRKPINAVMAHLPGALTSKKSPTTKTSAGSKKTSPKKSATLKHTGPTKKTTKKVTAGSTGMQSAKKRVKGKK